MPFLGGPILVPDTLTFDRWCLYEPLVYEGSTDFFYVPAGFSTDGASIPAILWPIVGHPFGRYAAAAILHDFLYRNATVSRSDADGIFRRCMRELGVPAWRRWGMWLAVRGFGWVAWWRRRSGRHR